MDQRASCGASKSALWLLVASVSLAASSVKAYVKEDRTSDGRTVYEFNIDGVDTKEVIGAWGDNYTQVTLKGVPGYDAVVYKVGEPSIPVIRFFVESNQGVTVMPSSDLQDLPNLMNYLFPNQMSMEKNHRGPVPFSFNAESYEDDEFIPNKVFDVEDMGKIRGVKRQMVTLYPYYYRPSTGEQRLRKSFKVVVKKSAPANTVSDKESMVFVIGEKYKDNEALKKYMDLKRKQGFWVYPEVVAAGKNGTPEKIRERLQQYYQRKDMDLKYVVLVGDIEDVPAYKAEFLSKSQPWFGGPSTELPTDHYYRVLDGAYTDDINGPDVGLGRFSVSTEAELETVLAKYTRYQNADFKNDAWLKKAAFTGSDDETFYQVTESTHDYVTDEITSKLGYTGNFPEVGMKGGDKLYVMRHKANASKLMDALNEGRGIVSYSGHGDYEAWDAPGLKSEELDQITNDDAIPFVLSAACITGQFSIPVSFAEAWQRHPKGAVFFFGSVDSSYWYEDDRMERRLYQDIAAANNLDFGTLTNAAVSEVYRYYGGAGRSKYYWETYTSFGDPSIELRTEQVRKPNLLAPRLNNKVGGMGVTLVDQAQKVVKHARLVLTLPNGQRHVLKTNENGYAQFSFDPQALAGGRSVNVQISGANLKPEMRSLSLN